MSCVDVLASESFYGERKQFSLAQLARLVELANQSEILTAESLGVFVAGSLGRLEMGQSSDIDFFPVTTEKELGDSYLGTCQVVSELARLNKQMDAPDFSNDGRFLRVYKSADLVERAGYADDDSGNHFTTRMLLLLEGRSALNPELVANVRQSVAEHYFRDQRGKSSFRPLYLVNDLLRYWRTLCLNYEIVRTENRPWRKKNINLKFSRMVTVYASVLAVLTGQVTSTKTLVELCERTPLERLATSIDVLADRDLTDEFSEILGLYRRFLELKDDESGDRVLDAVRDEIRENAEKLSCYLHRALTHEKIPPELRRYVVI